MLKVLVIIGTRPEAIKMAPVVKELRKWPESICPIVCATGQHREMLDQVLQVFDITPDYQLDLMQPGQTLPLLTARIITALDDVFAAEKPDWVLVQGDTTTVTAASLVAFYHRVKVGHIEAGLRSGDKFQPFPEEINRRICDLLADLYFAPTPQSRDTLLREQINPERIIVTGNTVIDALMMAVQRQNGNLPAFLEKIGGRRLILVTAHRRENFGAPFAEICRAIRQIAERYPDDVQIVYPVHYNPNVRGPAHETLGGIPNITLLEPLDYEAMVALMSRAYLILTDSGGLQEEAPSLKKPVLVLRDVTERTEVVELGAAILVGSECEKIVHETARLLDDPDAYRRMAHAGNPYGDGSASRWIVAALQEYSKES